MMAARILVVDDSPTITRMVEDILLPHGYDVYTAWDGLSGLNMLESCSPDLVILDITMPFFDGLEWLEITRRYSKHADLPVVMLSGRTSDSDIKGALEKGAVAYLTKPLDANKLLAVVSEQLAAPPQAV